MNWLQQSSGTNQTLQAVSFTDLYNGTTVAKSGIILNTTDGGNTWNQQNRITTNDLYDVFFTSPNIGTAIGEAGTIINTTYPGITSIETEREDKPFPSGFSLSQNYPNPFNPTTKIKFSIPQNVRRETANVSLKIYDVLGREIATLINEEIRQGRTAGEYEVEFNAENLPTGIYFYRLKAGDFIQTKKMVLLK